MKHKQAIGRAYTTYELKRFNRYIKTMDEQMARCLMLHQLLGTRISDTLLLETTCLFYKDGNPVTYTITSNFCAQVAFDTNGNSAPNQYGADVFSLRVREDGTFTGWGKSGWDSLKNILNGGNPIYTKYAEGQKKD